MRVKPARHGAARPVGLRACLHTPRIMCMQLHVSRARITCADWPRARARMRIWYMRDSRACERGRAAEEGAAGEAMPLLRNAALQHPDPTAAAFAAHPDVARAADGPLKAAPGCSATAGDAAACVPASSEAYAFGHGAQQGSAAERAGARAGSGAGLGLAHDGGAHSNGARHSRDAELAGGEAGNKLGSGSGQGWARSKAGHGAEQGGKGEGLGSGQEGETEMPEQTLKQCLRDARFWLLWSTFFTGMGAGFCFLNNLAQVTACGALVAPQTQ